jgi:hypothetical protein
MSTLHRFELPDLLVTLCERGQTSLAARIARTLLGSSSSESARASAARQARDLSERTAKDCGVACDESQPPRAIESLQDDLEATSDRR